MQYKFVALLSLFALFTSSQALANTNCAQIENARERLACYDTENPPEGGAPSGPRLQSEPILPPSRLGQPSTEPVTLAPRTRTDTSAPPNPNSGGGLFDWVEDQEFESEIAALRRGDQQRMVFRLTNGQIWMQSSPRELPFSIGDSVTVKSARMGGYILRSQAGTSTRVRRLE